MNTIDLRLTSFEKSKDLVLVERTRTIVNTDSKFLDYINCVSKLKDINNFIFVGPSASGKSYNKDLIKSKYSPNEVCDFPITDKWLTQPSQIIQFKLVAIEGITMKSVRYLYCLAGTLQLMKEVLQPQIPQIIATYSAVSADELVKNMPLLFKYFNVITCSYNQ
jgi:hypothetical protein